MLTGNKRAPARMIIVLLIAALIAPGAAYGAGAQAGYAALEETIDLLKTHHLSGISEEEMIRAAIEGILEELDDPYTEYYTAEEIGAFFDALNDRYTGTGLVVIEMDGRFVILDVFENSPAAGVLREGDVVIAINGESTEGYALYDLAAAEYGEPGQSVTLAVERDGKRIEAKLEYAPVQPPLVESRWLGEGLGYLRLTTFSELSAWEFAVKLEQLAQQGLDSLILDLRYNGGGLLDAVVQIAGHFIGNDRLMELRDRDGKRRSVHANGRVSPKVTVPLAILVNEGTASAAEVLAGALQHYKAGVVIGETTYGKGVVQQMFPLKSSGGMLKMTVEEYLTPDRKPVHERGIKPDIAVEGYTGQLLKAIHALGLDRMKIAFHKTKLSINGQMFYKDVGIVERDGELLLPSRFAAAVLGAELEWDEAGRQVVIAKDGIAVPYPLDSLYVAEGISYIGISALQQHFPWLKRLDGEPVPTIEAVFAAAAAE